MDWKDNFFSIVIGATLLVSGAWLAYTPWAAAHAIEQAARSGDEDALGKLVDFDRVAGSLKAQLEAQLDAVIARASANDTTTVLDAALAETFIDPAVDMLLQPRSIAAMMEGNVPKAAPGADAPAAPPAPAGAAAFDISMRYEGINTFAIRATLKDANAQPIVLVLTRQDSVSWKLTDIRLPKSAVATDDELVAAATKPEPKREGVSAFDGNCVDAHVASFREANGEDAEPTSGMLSGWLAECSQ